MATIKQATNKIQAYSQSESYINIPVTHENVWQYVVNVAAKNYNIHHPESELNVTNFTRYNKVMDEWFGDHDKISLYYDNNVYTLERDYLEGYNELALEMTHYYYDNWIV